MYWSEWSLTCVGAFCSVVPKPGDSDRREACAQAAAWRECLHCLYVDMVN